MFDKVYGYVKKWVTEIVSHFRVDCSDICFYCGRDRAASR